MQTLHQVVFPVVSLCHEAALAFKFILLAASSKLLLPGTSLVPLGWWPGSPGQPGTSWSSWLGQQTLTQVLLLHLLLLPAMRGVLPVPTLLAALGSLTEVWQEETLVSDVRKSTRFYDSIGQRLGKRLREDRLVDPVGDSHGHGEHKATG